MPKQRVSDAPTNHGDLLSEVFDQTPTFMAMLTGEQHVFEMVNAAYSQLVGHREVVGKRVLAALPELEGQGYIELLDAVLRTGRPYVGKAMKVVLRSDPAGPLTERYVDFVYQARRNHDGEIIGVTVYGDEVTDAVIARQHAEEHAEQATGKAQAFEALMASIPDFIYTFDRDGRFTFANKPLLDLLGLSLEDIRGKTFHELPYPDDLATTLEAHIHQVVDAKAPVVDETPYSSPSGKAGYYEYIFSPVFDDDGAVAVVAGSTRDITERVWREREKDQFLGIVSHELKTPVTSLKAYAQFVQRRLAKEGDLSAAEHLAKMESQIDKLSALIDDLLDVTRISSGQLQMREDDFAFDDIVVEAVEEVQRLTEQHRVVLEGTTGQFVHGDKDRLGQVIINLLTNAVKFSPHAERVVVNSTADDRRVEVCVQDFGIGIEATQLPHVFERYYRAGEGEQKSAPGLGLGLNIASNIIQRHGGRIWAESEPGRGTVFCFSLPVVAKAEGPDAL